MGNLLVRVTLLGDPRRESYLVHAAKNRMDKKGCFEKGRPRGVKIMFRGRVVNRRDENKA